MDRVCPVQATAGSSEQAHARFVPLALSGDHVHLVDSLDAVTAMAVSLAKFRTTITTHSNEEC